MSITIKAAKHNFYKQKFEKCNGNVKQTWKEINKILGKQSDNVNRTFKINNTVTKDKDVIANAFNEHYVQLGTDISSSMGSANCNFRRYLPRQNYQNMRWDLTTEAEIKTILLKMNNTSAGPDEIPISVYKNNFDLLGPIISYLFNLSLSSGIFSKYFI